MKRFTETEKWRDPWYISLPPRVKLLWLYFCDTCDHAGVFQIDWGLASYVIGQKVTLKDLEFFEDRIQLLPSGRYLIKKYVKFQSGNLTEACPAHKPILKLVEQHGLIQTSLGYQYPMARVLTQVDYCYPEYPMAYPSVRVQEKEKEKRDRKEIEKKEGGMGETETEIIYSFYPRKVGKEDALRAITKALKKYPELREQILEHTKAMGEAWKNEPDKQFCPHPATWFNEGRYLDEIETYKPHSKFKTNQRNAGIGINATEQGRQAAALIAKRNGSHQPELIGGNGV